MTLRREYKYLVSREKLTSLRKRLRPFVKLDKYAGENGGNDYKVRSIYFDTGTMDYYHQKSDGVKKRKKFRLRGYNDNFEDSTVFLEIKRKNNEIVSKNRSPLKYQDIHKLFITGDSESLIIGNNGNSKAKTDADKFLYYLNTEYLIPVILIVYDREPYYSKFNSNLRITFDKNIRSKVCTSLDGLFTEHKEKYAVNDYFVLEIKFNFGYPGWLDNIIREFELTRQAVSKYCICVDNHRQEIEMLFSHSSIEFFSDVIYKKEIFKGALNKDDQ